VMRQAVLLSSPKKLVSQYTHKPGFVNG
jgi:hypothetical protein